MDLTWCTRLGDRARPRCVMRWTSHRHVPENRPAHARDARSGRLLRRNTDPVSGAERREPGRLALAGGVGGRPPTGDRLISSRGSGAGAGDAGDLAALRDEAPGGVPDLDLLVEPAVGQE